MGVGVIGAILSAPSQYEDLITTSTTWVKPAGVKTAEVTVAGGGGSNFGTGGAGYYKGIINIENVSNLPITIGASGSTGGTTVVGDFVACTGGSAPFGSNRIGALGSVVFANQRQSLASNGIGVVSERRNILNDGQSYRWRYKVAGFDLILMRDETQSVWVASKDSGATWTRLSTASANALDAAAFTSLQTNTEVAAYLEGSPAGYIYSFDRAAINNNVSNVATSVDGITWTTRNLGQNIFSVAMTPTRTVVAHTGGVFASTDNGANWTSLTATYTNVSAMLYVRSRDALVIFRNNDTNVYFAYGSTNFGSWSSVAFSTILGGSLSGFNSSNYFKISNTNANGQALLVQNGPEIWLHWKNSNGHGYSHYAYFTTPASGNSWTGWSGSTYGAVNTTSGQVSITTMPMVGETASTFNRRAVVLQQNNSGQSPVWYTQVIEYEAQGVNSFGFGVYTGNFTNSTAAPFLLNGSPTSPGNTVFARIGNSLFAYLYSSPASQNSLPVGSFWGGQLGTAGSNNIGGSPGAGGSGSRGSTDLTPGPGSEEGWCAGSSSDAADTAQWQFGSYNQGGAVKIRYWR